MFNPSSKNDLMRAYDLWDERNSDFYSSTTWLNAKARYETRRNAYYRKYDRSQPLFRNQLYFPVFYMACKAFEAAIKETIQPPIVNILYKSNTKLNPALYEMERLQNYDIQRDLYVSNFERKLFSMYWYNQIFGTSIGRETMESERKVNKQKRVIMRADSGLESIVEDTSVRVLEHTRTDVIHPLNFAQPLNRGEIYDSEWVSVRYELSVPDIYAMQGHPLANKDGLKRVIKEIESGNVGWTGSDDLYYCDQTEYESGKFRQNTVIGFECSGDMQFHGNYGDNTLHWGIYAPQYREWLLIGPSPYARHPFWKMRANPDPMSPYGVGPCDTLIPVNLMKNKVFNQYLDWTDSNLKFNYQAYPGYIRGGLRSIIDNPAGGFIEAIDEQSWRNSNGNLIRAVEKDKSGIPGIGDAFNTLDKLEIEASIASSRKSSVEGITKTATGEMQVAEQQNAALESITRDMDFGLRDAIWQKIQNRRRFVTEREIATMGENEPSVLYYPFELVDEDADIEVQRIQPTTEANKYMAFLGKVTEAITAISQVPQIDISTVIRQYDKIGRQLGIEGIDGLLQSPGMAPQVNTPAPQAMGAPANPVMSPQPTPNTLPPPVSVAAGQQALAA